jgi:hypothetical protein
VEGKGWQPVAIRTPMGRNKPSTPTRLKDFNDYIETISLTKSVKNSFRYSRLAGERGVAWDQKTYRAPPLTTSLALAGVSSCRACLDPYCIQHARALQMEDVVNKLLLLLVVHVSDHSTATDHRLKEKT